MTIEARLFGPAWKSRMVQRCAFVTALIVLYLGNAVAAPPATVNITPASPTAPEPWSKVADTVFQHVAPVNGFPYAEVSELAEDADGFVWVGTQNGAARWDGYRFHIYKNEAKDPNSLPQSSVRTMYLDGQKRLWFGTATGGLARYDRDHDRFIRFPVGKDGISHISIRGMTGDGAEGIWVGTDGGLNHLDPATGMIKSWRHDPMVAGSLPDNRIRAVLHDTTGVLWVGTTKGLVRRAGKGSGDIRFIPVQLPIASGHATFISKLFQASDGRIWIGTRENGAFVFDPKLGSIAAVQEVGTLSQSPSNDFVFAFAETTAGDIWIGTAGHGALVVSKDGSQTRRIRHDPRNPSGLRDDSIFDILRDRSGMLWIGDGAGFSRHDPMQTAVLSVFGSTTRESSVSSKDVLSIMQTAEGDIWLGLYTHGIDVFDPAVGRIKNFMPDPKSNIGSMVGAIDGTKYIATANRLVHVDRSGHLISTITVASPSVKPVGQVVAMVADGNRLWIGGAFDSLLLLDTRQGSGTVAVRPPGIEKLANARVNSLELAQDGALWIGSIRGLYRYDPVTHELETIMPNEADPQGLSDGAIPTLLTDRKKRLWIGTTGGGINVMVGRDAKGAPRFRRLGTKDGLPDANIATLLQAADGNIWASTDNGMAIIDPETFAIKSLGLADGLAFRTFFNNSGVITENGDMVFGARGGVTIIRPDRYKEWTYRPTVVATEIRVNSKVVPANRFNGVQPAGMEALMIAPDENKFAVEFAALDYSSPESNRYAYRLDGVDKAWIDTDSSRRLASYSNLPPGDYRLRVRGSNRKGVWTEQELLLPIRVLPAWYQTWWMRLIAGVVACTAIYGVVHARTRYLRLRQRELESQVRKRTRELETNQLELIESNAELGRSKDQIQIQNEELLKQAEVLQTQAEELQKQAEELQKQAHYDFLTGCLSRRAFFAQGEAVYQDTIAKNGNLFCIMADIDHFKFFNDQFGHAVGDTVIQSLAAALRRSLRNADLFCRYGGEEFCILLVDTDAETGMLVAERIRARIQKECGAGVRSVAGLQITSSLGAVPLIKDSAYPSFPELIEQADRALYVAKHAGRNRVADRHGDIVYGENPPPQVAVPDGSTITESITKQ